MKSLIHSSRVANKNDQDYEARSNIMWTAAWALNTLVAKAKSTDWMVHMLGQAVGAHTDATHGMTLSAVSLPYYRYIMSYGLAKFKRFEVNVWDVDADGKSDEQRVLEGLAFNYVYAYREKQNKLMLGKHVLTIKIGIRHLYVWILQ